MSKQTKLVVLSNDTWVDSAFLLRLYTLPCFSSACYYYVHYAHALNAKVAEKYISLCCTTNYVDPVFWKFITLSRALFCLHKTVENSKL